MVIDGTLNFLLPSVPMHTLSVLLLILAGLAAAGLFYELAVERRRASLRARSEREWQRLTARPVGRLHSGK
jgi:CHASE1-domain containing sensor protein